MRGFKQFFDEAIGIPKSCKEFGTYSQTNGWWFAGAGSEYGCHKKNKIKTLKYEFNDKVKKEAAYFEGTPNKFWQTGLNNGAGGGPGKAQEPNPAINISKDNSGAGGGSGKTQPASQPLKNVGCGGGPSAGGPCNTESKGCSGYMCGDAGSGGGVSATPATTGASKATATGSSQSAAPTPTTSKTK